MRFLMALGAGLFISASAWSYSSRSVFVPSSEFQDQGRMNLEMTGYLSPFSREDRSPIPPGFSVSNTVGLVALEDVRFEAGLDWDEFYQSGSDKVLRAHLKTGLLENQTWPSLAMGVMMFGFRPGESDYNIIYVLAGKSFSQLGSFSVGAYVGSVNQLKDENGVPANKGLLLSWRRAMTEVNPKLEILADWVGGISQLGALSGALRWKVAEEARFMAGYTAQTNQRMLKDQVVLRTEFDF